MRDDRQGETEGEGEIEIGDSIVIDLSDLVYR